MLEKRRSRTKAYDPSPGITPGPKPRNLQTWGSAGSACLTLTEKCCQFYTPSHTQEQPTALTDASLKDRFTYLSKQSVKNLHIIISHVKYICTRNKDQNEEGAWMEMFLLVKLVTLFKKIEDTGIFADRLLLGKLFTCNSFEGIDTLSDPTNLKTQSEKYSFEKTC